MDWLKGNIVSIATLFAMVLIAVAGSFGASYTVMKSEQTSMSKQQVAINSKLELLIPYVARFDDQALDIQKLQDSAETSQMITERLEVALTKNTQASENLLEFMNTINSNQAAMEAKLEGVDYRVKLIEEKVNL